MSIEVGNRVRQIRARMGLNQRDFASRLGISSGGISQIESGKTMPGGDFLLRIYQEFDVDITWLLSGVSTTKLTSSTLSEEKQALLDAYDEMTPRQRASLLEVSRVFTQPDTDTEAG